VDNQLRTVNIKTHGSGYAIINGKSIEELADLLNITESSFNTG